MKQSSVQPSPLWLFPSSHSSK